MNDLKGKVALITGGSRGIGAAIARGLSLNGAEVAITYRQSEEEARGLARNLSHAGRRSLAIEADSADPGQIQGAVDRVADELGRLDILVNNAGIFPSGPLEDVSIEELDRTLAIHTRAPFLASQAAALHLGRGGRIINIGSCFVDRVPYEGVSLYAMSKSALVGLTKGFARDLGGRGITVNLINPGSTDTDMNPADSPESEEERNLIALGRYADAEEIAATVIHLASESGSFITGSSIAVDGGFAS